MNRLCTGTAILLLGGAAGIAQAQRPQAYLKAATDPIAVERGRTLFVTYGCTFCHGADARGGNGGPNLLRTQTVLRDSKGELIAVPLQKGVAGTTMAAFPLKDPEVADIAQFLHSFDAFGYDNSRMKPAVFTMGDARAGQKYFTRRCASCHQADGDLKGIASTGSQPRDLQQRWLMPRSSTPTTATVTLADGSVLNGRLVRMDEFLLTLELSDGSQRNIDRNGDVPRVDVKNPRSAHKALLPTYRDSDIHNVTAYLATLK